MQFQVVIAHGRGNSELLNDTVSRILLADIYT